jgi:hypothetical protein
VRLRHDQWPVLLLHSFLDPRDPHGDLDHNWLGLLQLTETLSRVFRVSAFSSIFVAVLTL